MDPATQLALSIGVPTLAILAGILVNNYRLNDFNARLSELRAHIDQRFDHMEKLFDAKLQRVEEVIDARLKHLEDERH